MIDDATLTDLGILWSGSHKGRTLLELVDRTRSGVGRQQLRLRLKTPLGSPEDVFNQQAAHRALAERALVYRGILDRAGLDGIQQYLESNWKLPAFKGRSGRTLASYNSWGWRAAYLEAVEVGRRRVADLLRAARELQSALHGSPASKLSDAASQLERLLDSEEMRRVSRFVDKGYARAEFDRLARHDARAAICGLLEWIGAVEAMWSLGVAAEDLGWRYPRPAGRFAARGLFHPLLEQQPVANDLDLSEHVRVCFITGPNMAGKTTFLRTVGLAMVLAHAGAAVPAESLDFPVCATIFSSLSICDRLEADESFYLAEVRRVASLARALVGPGTGVAVLDEPLRGTNVHDAAEATLALVSGLASHPRALAFVASHISEIAPAVEGNRHVRLLHFAADVVGGKPRFDFRLRDGVSHQRLGMTLLRQEGVLDLLSSGAQASGMSE